eukprot:scaffold7500_cov286-Pinguiococcus_pyrenoidosus.AAC.2
MNKEGHVYLILDSAVSFNFIGPLHGILRRCADELCYGQRQHRGCHKTASAVLLCAVPTP